ncbi:MAG: hypothetical protein M1457_05300 [bacterium]|nr:hypothetical protein [bacterium]
MIRKLCVACFFSLCLTSLSTAATITVAQAGGADQTTILGALAAANSGDVIQINDSATYTEALPNSINTGAGGAILDSLTIQVAAGMTPTIENTSATGFIFGPGSATTTVSGPFVIQGASNTARLNLRTAANPAVGGGPNLASTHAITLENTNIVRTTAGTYVQANNQGNWLLNNVDFIGAPNFGGTMVLYGVNPPPAGPWAGSFTGNNVDMRPGGGRQ